MKFGFRKLRLHDLWRVHRTPSWRSGAFLSGRAEAMNGKVFELTLPLDQVAEGYRAMDQRLAKKALLHPKSTRCRWP